MIQPELEPIRADSVAAGAAKEEAAVVADTAGTAVQSAGHAAVPPATTYAAPADTRSYHDLEFDQRAPGGLRDEAHPVTPDPRAGWRGHEENDQ